MARGGGDSEKVADSDSADSGASEGAANGQTTTEQGPTTQTGDDSQQGTESQEPAAAGVAEVNGKSYSSLQAAVDAASEKAKVKLLADTKENVTISTKNVTLDLNGYTLNGSTGERKPALTVTSRVYVEDSSQAQTGTIMREDTKENSGVSSHYVIDVQGGNSGWLFFRGGNVKNDSGAGGTNGAPLVRVGDGKQSGLPHMTITGGTFTQDNFIVLKCDSGILSVAGGAINSKNSYAIQNWKTTYIKDGDKGASRPVINGNVSTWTYKGSGSSLEISGGTVTGKVESVTYDGAAGKPAKVAIIGGTVEGQLYTLGYNSSTGTSTEINDPAKATIEVSGGTFKTDPSRYLVESSSATQNADGTYGVAKAYLAKVGETSYYTMEDAINAQTTSGNAITLLRDYTTGSVFASGNKANRVVDLNGYTWTCTGAGASFAAFQINYPNSSITVKNGKVVSSLPIGLITSAKNDYTGEITPYDNSSLTFDGVEASTTATSGIETNGNNTNDTVVLKNSTLNVPNGFGIYFPSSGTLTIDNSTINAKTMGVQVCSGNLNVTAGSAITVSGDPVEKLEGDGAIQDGAAISIVNRSGYKGLGQVAITGGAFTAKAGNAALKAYAWDSSTKQESAFDNTAKKVTVSGGTFSSAVSSDLCAEGFAPVVNDDGSYSVGVPVAKINDAAYTSLQAAVNAVREGETVQLLADTVVDDTVIVGDKGTITLDLNGKTISNTREIWNEGAYKWSLISVRGNSNLTITGNGAIDALENDVYAIDLYDVASKCTIENGTFTGNISSAYVWEGVLTINGGTFDIKQLSQGQEGRRLTINCYDSNYKSGTAQVTIAGGTFNGFDPANNLAEGTGTTFTAPGYASVANTDGTFGVVAGVAQIGTKAYATLADAVAAAQDGDTITLLSDCSGNGIKVKDDTFPNGLTIDFAGHSYTVGGKLVGSAGTASNGFQLLKGNTIVMRNGSIFGDASVAGDDTTQWSGSPAIMIQNYSNLTLDGMTVKGGKQTCYTLSNNNGDTVIKDSTIVAGQNTLYKGPWAFDVCRYASYPSVSVTVEGNSVIKGDVDVSGTIGKDQSRQLTITGGKFDKAITVSNKPANIAISGGTFATEIPAEYCAAGYAPAKNDDGTYGVKLPQGAYALQDYRSGDQASWTYPSPQKGMAFAGWYKDASFTTACSKSDVEGAAYAKFVEISDLITFKGGSLRTDLTGKDDYSKTSLRFGYEMHAPEGSKIDFQNWGWYYKSPSSANETFHKAENYWRIDNNGVIANFVLSPIYKSGYQLDYSTVFDVTAQLAYTTVDGTGVKVKDQSKSRSVDQVAKAIQNDSFASDDDVAYANGILGSN